MDSGATAYRRTHGAAEDSVTVVRGHMPLREERALQPTIAVITSQYHEKVAVDAVMTNKRTFVRYATVGKSLTSLYICLVVLCMSKSCFHCCTVRMCILKWLFSFEHLFPVLHYFFIIIIKCVLCVCQFGCYFSCFFLPNFFAGFATISLLRRPDLYDALGLWSELVLVSLRVVHFC